MKPTQVLQEIRKMRFEEAYEGWNAGRLTQAEAARILGVCERSFRRYRVRYEVDGLAGLVDRRLEQASNRLASVDEVIAMTDEYRSRYTGWNVKHFHSGYRRTTSSFQGVQDVIEARGLFSSFYSDRGSHYYSDRGSHYWHTPEARGRSERAFGTHQGRLPFELAAAGITDMEAANHYLQAIYLPAFNAEFACPAPEQGSAFVPWIGGNLGDILCEQHERTVGNDNCMRYEGLVLQIPADQHRCHYVKAKVRVHRYSDGRLAVFHGSRKLSDYDREGKTFTQNLKQAA